jgi:2-haloacid dehalogenase
MLDPGSIRALFFDVFGTVVDWRAGVAREAAAVLAQKGHRLDWAKFADAWRALYQPAMERVRSGGRGFVTLDQLHRENLDEVLASLAISGLSEAERAHLARAWHRLDPWPDSVPGMARLKRRYILAAQSNGNIALIAHMAKRAGIPWDVILGAEVVGAYKPMPEAYRRAAAALDLAPAECLMVAAHNSDLAAAAGTGFRTAFVARPLEYGPGGKNFDLVADPGIDLAAKDMEDLAAKLGC